jgi:hypothetical protein
MQDDDKIFKALGDKLRDYEAGEASDADWAAFQAVYPAKKKKKRAFIWFLIPLLGISFALLAWFIQLKPFEKLAAPVAQNNLNTILSESKTEINIPSTESLEKTKQELSLHSNGSSEKQKIQDSEIQNQTRKEKKKIKNQSTPNSTILFPLAKEKKLNINPNTKINDGLISEKQTLQNQQEEPENLNVKVFADLKNESPTITNKILSDSENNLNEFKKELIDISNDSIFDVPKNLAPISQAKDSIINQQNKVKAISKIQLPLKHIDLNAIYSPGMAIYNNTLYANNLIGIGLGVAFGISKHVYLSTGLNYMYGNTQSSIKKEMPHEYSSISKIDTSLKFDLASSTIMMDIDTHFQKHTGTRIDEFSIVRKSQVLSIPVIFGYGIGNQKSELSLYGGVQNDWLVETYTTNNLTSKATETFTNQKLLAAPLVGFGYSRKFYANWALNLGMDYRHYLSSSLDKKEYWRVQAGIRYHLN